MELIFALFVAATLVWFVQQAWVPEIEKAIQQMPMTGEICDGRLAWPSEAVLLQEGPFMRIHVSPGGFTEMGVVESADLVLAFGPNDLKLGSSLGLGLLTLPYPPGCLFFSKNRSCFSLPCRSWRPLHMIKTMPSAAGVLPAIENLIARVYFCSLSYPPLGGWGQL